MINKILIPTDGSANSLTALEYGIYIAHKLGAALIGPLCSGCEFDSGADAYRHFRLSRNAALRRFFLTSLKQALNERQICILKEFQERCQKSGINVEVKKTIVKSAQ